MVTLKTLVATVVTSVPNTIPAIQAVLVIGVVLAAAALLALYVKNHTLEQIRGDVYKLFLQVEHKYIKSGSGQKKLDEVVNTAYDMLPAWAKIFFTRRILRKIIDSWFSKIKDLLDDGKANNSNGSGAS